MHETRPEPQAHRCNANDYFLVHVRKAAAITYSLTSNGRRLRESVVATRCGTSHHV